MIIASNIIRVFKTGAHSHRTPLSYAALAPLFENNIRFVDMPEKADVYVFGHSLDIEAAPRRLVDDWRRRQRPIILLSEEPFWDTIWGRQPLYSQRIIESPWGRLPVRQLIHHTSTIFNFEKIPYYLLTNHRFANAYAARFTRNARLSPSEWRQSWKRRSADLTFMFERRPEPYHSMSWPEGDIEGLCAWRTEVATQCKNGVIERIGNSWHADQPSRHTYIDWHLDKLVQLDGRSRLIGAFENTHQPNYITEKLFDAFACGALPAYVASHRHRVHEFGLPTTSWLNLAGLSPSQAAKHLDLICWDDRAWLDETADGYAVAQRKLAELFTDTRIWRQERNRLRDALLSEFQECLASAPIGQ